MDHKNGSEPPSQLPTLPRARGAVQFVFLAALVGALCYVLLIQQINQIMHPWWFSAIIVLLVFAAFMGSATEAAFSVAEKSKVYEAVDDDLEKIAAQLDPLEEKIAEHGLAQLDRAEKRELSKLMRRLARVQRKKSALDGTDRDQFVGALAAFSVFMTTGLAAFLPVTLMTPDPKQFLRIPYGGLESITDGMIFRVHWYHFSGQKLLIFFAASLMVLIFGKIVPKICGLTWPKQFAYSCYGFARVIQWTLGWVTLGIKWALSGVLKKFGVRLS